MRTKQRVKWDLDPNRTALIIINMQKAFCEPDGALYVRNTEHIIDNIRSVSDTARKAGMPVVYLRHKVRGDGDSNRMNDMYPKVVDLLRRRTIDSEIIDELAPKPEDIIINKLFYSGFHFTDLDTILRSRDVDTLIVCGTATNVCCEATVRDAVHKEYKAIVLSDANAAADYPDMGWGAVSAEEIQRLSLTAIAYEFGQVSSTMEIVGEIETNISEGFASFHSA
ncbi:isochorismatase family protein [Paenibacillus alkalitolerans]|uniref:isochorismatase family protein n=1 Tax=Paenibacillus alkalitolerans TaxID=2799335 RepID=UPI0018F4110A|nr:isochorismatase family cysteine hydrolase [Paenibacillus alkalitolerans]